MRSIYLAAGVLIGLTTFVGCGGDDKPPNGDSPAGGSSSGGKGSGGKNSTPDPVGGEGGTGADVDPLAPSVVITAPTEVTDPNGGDVLIADMITATCKVTKSAEVGASAVNASSVKIALLDGDGKVVDEKDAKVAEGDDEYSTDFSLVTIANGPVGFRCTAEDVDKRVGSTKSWSLVDHGPTIEFAKPLDMTAYALAKPLDIEFTVASAPLTDDDEQAEVSEVTLQVAGVDIDLADAEDKPGHYRLQVDLKDPMFNPTPNGPIPLVVKATNERVPTAVTHTSTLNPAIDGAPPTIKIVSPLDKDVVGGNVQLRFTAEDPISGVEQSTIAVSLNDTRYPYDPNSDAWSYFNGTYTFEFDSRVVKDAKVQITVNVGASDKVGNASTVVSELLYLDNYPPSIDLDPLNVRAIKIGNNEHCSISFDPVGNLSKNDLDSAAVAGMFRAMILDRTNSVAEIPVKHFAYTDPKSVSLYLEGDNTKPLLVDLDRDGLCDEVAEVDSPRSVELMPIPKANYPVFDKNDVATAPTAASFGCPEETQVTTPDLLCKNDKSDMWQVIGETGTGDRSAIFARSVSGLETEECTGVAWEFTGKLDKDGWVCFAARALDNVGNVGISRPLRLCVDDPDVDGTPACATSSVTPPTCTDGCTPPPRLGGVLFEQ